MTNTTNTAIPHLLVDELQARANIESFVKKAARHSLLFRPHFKTHQSVQVGEWFREAGVHAITVSSLLMARKFAAAGWNDITIAFPLNVLEAEGYAQLAGEINLNVLFDMPEQALAFREKLKHEAGYFIKIDAGYHRSGVTPQDTATLDEIISAAGPKLHFKGFLNHAGQTYNAKSREEILGIHHSNAKTLHTLRQTYQDRFPGIITSTGDTPSCSLADDFRGIDEIRPGNFVYYDLMQFQLGSCSFEQIAAAVICPVVSVYPHRNEALIYGGAVHLSKESLEDGDTFKIYGLAVPFQNEKWQAPQGDDYLVRLSQEHGILKTDSQWAKSLKPGDSVAVIPVHSCLAASALLGSRE